MGKKSTRIIIKNRVVKIILALIIHGFIVNQIASDGAQKIVSAIMQMTTAKSKDIFHN